MPTTSFPSPAPIRTERRQPWALIVLLILALIGAGLWGLARLQSGQPEPVTLDAREETILDAKLEAVASPTDPDQPLVAEIYQETDAARVIRFSERELNALIARDRDLAGRVAVRLSPGQVSTRVRIDVPADVTLLGGRVLNVRSGVRIELADEGLTARLIGVSVAGVPLPAAWLGGLKDEDLLALTAFRGLGAGIEHLEVGEGELILRLAR